MQYINSRRGFALSIVMWIVAALLLGTVLILSTSKNTLTLTKGVQDKLTARLMAQNYLEVLKYYVLTANFNSMSLINDVQLPPFRLPRQIILDGRVYNVTKNLTFSMQDASSMINAAHPNGLLIAKFLSKDKNNTLMTAINDSVMNWAGQYSASNLDGAEAGYYKRHRKPYVPRNYNALQSIDELRLIRGIDNVSHKDFDKLSKYLYCAQDGSVVNLALVNTTYLSYLLNINSKEAQALENIKLNNYNKFVNIIQSNKHYNADWMGLAISFNIRIKITAKVGNAVVRLDTLVDFRKHQHQHKNITTDFYKIY